MLNIIMSAAFKNIGKAHQIRLYIGIWILNTVSDASLGCQINYYIRMIELKYLFQG